MKGIILSITLLASTLVYGQHEVSTDLLGFAFGKYGLGYEYLMNSQNSVGIYMDFSERNLWGVSKNDYGDINYSEFNIIPEYKYYLTPEKGNDGVYVGVYLRYRSSNSTGNEYFGVDPEDANEFVSGKTDVKTTGLAIGAQAGYKWLASEKLYFEPTIGVGRFVTTNVEFSKSVVEDLTEEEFDENDYIPYIGNGLAVDLRLMLRIGLRFGGGE